ncbi:MAG: RsmE family RNA methyltransferase [Deltaproteobacteria bacterium]|nr:RsmE family RNA methyltransferase [Deltaproteobacteria bacterium]
MPQFFIDPKDIHENFATLRGEEVKHLTRVLRYDVGDKLWVSDGKTQYLGEIVSITKGEAKLKILQQQEPTLVAAPPIIAIALLKHDNLEIVLQKCVELGIREFHLLITARTIPHYSESTTPKKLARWEKIVFEAAKQSGMPSLPKIHPPVPFANFVQTFSDYSDVILAYEGEKETRLKNQIKEIDTKNFVVLIGPEGGWTEDEVTLAKKAGAKTVSLGGQMLRAETAAIATATLCQYELGNI